MSSGLRRRGGLLFALVLIANSFNPILAHPAAPAPVSTAPGIKDLSRHTAVGTGRKPSPGDRKNARSAQQSGGTHIPRPHLRHKLHKRSIPRFDLFSVPRSPRVAAEQQRAQRLQQAARARLRKRLQALGRKAGDGALHRALSRSMQALWAVEGAARRRRRSHHLATHATYSAAPLALGTSVKHGISPHIGGGGGGTPSGTSVSGMITADTEWTPAGSPYIVN